MSNKKRYVQSKNGNTHNSRTSAQSGKPKNGGRTAAKKQGFKPEYLAYILLGVLVVVVIVAVIVVMTSTGGAGGGGTTLPPCCQ